MENALKRHVNLIVLAVALTAQLVGLAFQIKVKSEDREPVRLIRVWTVGVIAPVEKAAMDTADFFRNAWHGYFWLRGVRTENERLQEENAKLRLEQVRLAEDAGQARRLQSLLKFKEQYISQTVAAQVIGGSGSELSRVVYIDKGEQDGIKPDMPVINPTGVVGKVIRVFPTTAQVLEINDQTSGIGAILETSRLQGILKGTPAGETQLNYVMSDESVKPGERVLTSGGDHIFPKGLPVGTVTFVGQGEGLFLAIRVKPAANLNRLEEVLVITKAVSKDVEPTAEGPMRAADILAQRLPTVPAKPPEQQPGAASAPAQNPGASAVSASGGGREARPTAGGTPAAPAKPAGTPGSQVKPAPGSPAQAKPPSGGAGTQVKQTAGMATGGARDARPAISGTPAPPAKPTGTPGSQVKPAPGSPSAQTKPLPSTPAVERPKLAKPQPETRPQ